MVQWGNSDDIPFRDFVNLEVQMINGSEKPTIQVSFLITPERIILAILGFNVIKIAMESVTDPGAKVGLFGYIEGEQSRKFFLAIADLIKEISEQGEKGKGFTIAAGNEVIVSYK